MPRQPVAIVIDAKPTPPDVATDGQGLDWYIADKRLASAETGAAWCADLLKEIEDLRHDSRVRELIEQAVAEVKEAFAISDEEIESET